MDQPGPTNTLAYGYNLASEPTSITYPSGRVVQPQYDMIGRTSTVTSGATNYASAFAYNPAQQVTGFSYGNGDTAAFTYSPDRLQLQTLAYKQGATNLFKLTYGYTQPGGNNGQITQITDNVSAGRTVNYTYDALNRLSTALTTGGATYPQWGLSWSYDRYGNRTAQTVTAGSAPSNSLTIDPATNRITGGYTYDANGNLKIEPLTPANNYGYDSENQMVSFSGSGSGTYSYDGNGLRVKKVSGTTTTVYLFSGSKVVAEYVNGAAPSAPTKEYIYLGSQLLATIASGVTTYHHPDHLSARISTNSSGAKVGDQGHYPFGESWYLTNTTTKWQFTSYERDAESGNDYAMARYDVNRIGRFVSPDPLYGSIGNPQSLDRYSYVLNDPVDLTDPLGLKIIIWKDCTDILVGDSKFPICYYTVIDVPDSRANDECPPDRKDCDKDDGLLKKLKNKIKQLYCNSIPSGRTEGLTGALGILGGETGTMEIVTNYNTGEQSLFFSGGPQAGASGGASGAYLLGFIQNLGASNSNYSGPFTNFSGSVGPIGGFEGQSSKGLSGPQRIDANAARVAGITVGASLVGGASANASITYYGPPINLGNLKNGQDVNTSPLLTLADYAYLLLRKPCQ